ncbi:RNA polymerase sigma-70 factor [Sphingobacterium hungaricum]|uniref:RNA polymerase sigma-70 factor n=1 Tax=Sphingobacterium hungaricum TaxID=2082723 RepID=A0A928UVX5_9SPHI|nr:RNA polymerase sigma-70 factor [Sphingobacterium hungaricum]MBE8714301.1 RNA polymerase sigma-70 factor [Sphingobacterium hungaricum]
MDYKLLSNEILSKLLKADDEIAFKEIYSRYWKLLFQTAYYRLGSKETAKELVQNVFLNLWEKRNVLIIDKLENYLQITIKNRVINYIETSIVQRKYQEHVVSSYDDRTMETESTVQYNELYFALEKALSELPVKTREVFQLSRFEKLSVKEIAIQMNLSEKAVEYHITSSLKALRFKLKDFMVACFILGSYHNF